MLLNKQNDHLKMVFVRIYVMLEQHQVGVIGYVLIPILQFSIPQILHSTKQNESEKNGKYPFENYPTIVNG